MLKNCDSSGLVNHPLNNENYYSQNIISTNVTPLQKLRDPQKGAKSRQLINFSQQFNPKNILLQTQLNELNRKSMFEQGLKDFKTHRQNQHNIPDYQTIAVGATNRSKQFLMTNNSSRSPGLNMSSSRYTHH